MAGGDDSVGWVPGCLDTTWLYKFFNPNCIKKHQDSTRDEPGFDLSTLD